MNGAFDTRHLFKVARLQAALVTNGTDDGALGSSRYVFGQAVLADAGDHGIDGGVWCAVLHDDDHVKLPGKMRKDPHLTGFFPGCACVMTFACPTVRATGKQPR